VTVARRLVIRMGAPFYGWRLRNDTVDAVPHPASLSSKLRPVAGYRAVPGGVLLFFKSLCHPLPGFLPRRRVGIQTPPVVRVSALTGSLDDSTAAVARAPSWRIVCTGPCTPTSLMTPVLWLNTAPSLKPSTDRVTLPLRCTCTHARRSGDPRGCGTAPARRCRCWRGCRQRVSRGRRRSPDTAGCWCRGPDSAAR